MSFVRNLNMLKRIICHSNLKSFLRLKHSDAKLNEAINYGLKSMLDDSSSLSERNPPTDQWVTPIYPPGVRRNQQQHSIRPQVEPQTTSVFLFPGQGSQYVGMSKSLVTYPNVKEMFECASEILRYNLLDLCLNGPEDMLNMTVHSQAAVMVASLAAVEKLRSENPWMIENCVAAAGFSVGEYSALVFAGALEFENAVRILKIRGEAMQAASDMHPSGMMTVFLSPVSKIKMACAAARKWCEEQGILNAECKIAIYLFPECKVISGHMEALKYLERNAAEFGIRKMKYLPVSGAFHSSLMLPAKKVLEKALKSIPFETPIIPVHANFDGKLFTDPEKTREKLAKQLCSPVAWEQTMHIIFERSKGQAFPNIVECGPGTSMKSILRNNNKEAYKSCTNVLA